MKNYILRDEKSPQSEHNRPFFHSKHLNLVTGNSYKNKVLDDNVGLKACSVNIYSEPKCCSAPSKGNNGIHPLKVEYL